MEKRKEEKKRKWKVEFDDKFLKDLAKTDDKSLHAIHKAIKSIAESDDPTKVKGVVEVTNVPYCFKCKNFHEKEEDCEE